MGERKDLRDLLRDTDFAQKRIIDDLANSDNEPSFNERGVAGDIRKSEGGDFVKNIFVGLLLVGIVVGSFWVSFLIGKKVLVPPVKNLATVEVPVQAPKTVSNADLEKATPVAEEPVAEEPATTLGPEQPITPRAAKAIAAKAGLPKPITSKKLAASKKLKTKAVPKAAAKTKGSKFYKVIVGTFPTAGEANQLVAQLKKGGFGSYVKKIAGGYRVQAGAFDSSAQASPLVVKLKNKGFTSEIIME